MRHQLSLSLLILLGVAVLNVQAKCVDQDADCPSLKSYCTDSQYKFYMEDHCPKTCGFDCTKKGAKKTKGDCSDLIDGCDRLASHCKSAEYKGYMKKNCFVTCGYDCPKKVTEPEKGIDKYTKTATGCLCYWDKTKKLGKACACCLKGFCQCGQGYRNKCVPCGKGNLCGGIDKYTQTSTGCLCYWDKTKKMGKHCACCKKGYCQCGKDFKDRCVPCGKGNLCSGVNKYTQVSTGCLCHWNKDKTDCACCKKGFCQCGKVGKNKCVPCGQGSLCAGEDKYTESSTGCLCHWDKTKKLGKACACCKKGFCQCGEKFKGKCVPCGQGKLCGK